MKTKNLSTALIILALISGSGQLVGAHSHEIVNAPGFRPQSELAASFLQRLPSNRIAVLPTLIRTAEGTDHSDASQTAAISFLQEKKLGSPEAMEVEVDLGVPQRKAQYDLFQDDLKKIGQTVKTSSGPDYFMVLEHLITPTPSGGTAVGGIHIYVLDSKGENAFSFLLNSHHKIFVEAKLRSADSSKEARSALVVKATQAALTALEQQVQAARAGD